MGRVRSRKSELSAHLAYVGLGVLAENGGKMRFGAIVEEVHRREYEKILDEDRVESRGGVQNWITRMGIFSHNFVRAGFLIKDKRFWFLTPKGEEALSRGEEAVIAAGLATRSSSNSDRR